MAFVVFEGIDGSGKSTLIQKLYQHLTAHGQQCVLSREPGGTSLGDAVRKLLLDPSGESPTARTELLLYQAIRAQHVERLIEPTLKKGEWLLCDRFTASSLAFQCYGRGIGRDQVDWLNQYATNGVAPDLTVLLDLDPQLARERLEQRNGAGHDRFELEKMEFHRRVRNGYLELAKQAAQRWLVLDARQSPDELFSHLIQQLRTRKWLAF